MMLRHHRRRKVWPGDRRSDHQTAQADRVLDFTSNTSVASLTHLSSIYGFPGFRTLCHGEAMCVRDRCSF